jgi:hypothetical protein
VAFLTDLKKYRKYGVVIQAFNEKGPGPMSSEIVTQTLEDGVFHFRDLVLFVPLPHSSTYFLNVLMQLFMLLQESDRKQVFVTMIISC